MNTSPTKSQYWALSQKALLSELQTAMVGLTTEQAAARPLAQPIGDQGRRRAIAMAFDQFKNPLLLILIVAAIIALLVQEWADALIVLGVLAMSSILGFYQEFVASKAVERLKSRIALLSTVIRDGATIKIPSARIVPGDLVVLSAGALIPADGVLLEAKDLFVNQALLTGESFPAEKFTEPAAPQASLVERSNCLYMGTSVRSGTGRMVVVRTGRDTEFGSVAQELRRRAPETEFERGLRTFGLLLTQVMVVFVVVIFAANLYLHRPFLESVLFAMALAVGLSPELLPAILTVTLAKGAQRMAKLGVIVRKLSAIENLGSMTVLCSDKTGTLTEGSLGLSAALGADQNPSDEVLRLAYWNASLQTGLPNPLDEAIVTSVAERNLNLAVLTKFDEIPYDFVRKRLTVIVPEPAGQRHLMITKGALTQILDICSDVGASDRERIEKLSADFGDRGNRVLGLASRLVEPRRSYSKADEVEFSFRGFLLFADPVRADVKGTLLELGRLGVSLKIITGDSQHVSRSVARTLGLKFDQLLTGRELNQMSDEALWQRVNAIDLFTEVDPSHKERIVAAFKRRGHIVGYLGDGINDAPALHTADVGISVDKAVDVAKESADIVLVSHDLKLLCHGISEGRVTFANTLKYIFTTTSANFGNMVSMAVASLLLPFLPLLATQVLLNNFLSDIPAIGVGSDLVDRDWRKMPHRWDMKMVRRFMISFGLVSSAFDFFTFGALLYVFHASENLFRTSWFVESLLTEIVIIFVVRTYRPFYSLKPGRFLLISSVLVAIVALALPYVPGATAFGFIPIPPVVMVSLIGITLSYLGASELLKRRLFKRVMGGA